MQSMPKSSAIASPELIFEIGKRMLKTGDKYYILYQMLIKTGISCTQLLEKRVSDVRNKSAISYYRQKTNQIEYQSLDEELQRELSLYTHSLPMDAYLFPSNKNNQPLNIYLIQKRLKDISTELQIPIVTVRSLMKTYQYHEYAKGGSRQKRIKHILHLHSTEALESYFGISLPSECNVSCEELVANLNVTHKKLLDAISSNQEGLSNAKKNILASLLQNMNECLHRMEEPD